MYFRYVEILYRYHISIKAGVQQDRLFENRIAETRDWTKLFFYWKLRYNNNLWKKQCGSAAKCCRGADRVVIIDKKIEIERGTLNEVFN